MPTMFFRLKLLVLLVLAFSAVVSVYAHNGEHSEGVITPIADGNDTRTADVETESRSRKKDLKLEPAPKQDSGWKGRVGDVVDKIVGKIRSADTDSEDAAAEGAASESRSRK
jgi:hypothetical protein